MKTKVLTARVPLPLAEKVDRLAARLQRSRDWVVKQALAAWIDQEEERRRLTLEALSDVEAGQIIDHQAVRAGLHLLEEHETKLQALRAALIEGEQSGPSEPFDFDRFLGGKRGPQARG